MYVKGVFYGSVNSAVYVYKYSYGFTDYFRPISVPYIMIYISLTENPADYMYHLSLHGISHAQFVGQVQVVQAMY